MRGLLPRRQAEQQRLPASAAPARRASTCPASQGGAGPAQTRGARAFTPTVPRAAGRGGRAARRQARHPAQVLPRQLQPGRGWGHAAQRRL